MTKSIFKVILGLLIFCSQSVMADSVQQASQPQAKPTKWQTVRHRLRKAAHKTLVGTTLFCQGYSNAAARQAEQQQRSTMPRSATTTYYPSLNSSTTTYHY